VCCDVVHLSKTLISTLFTHTLTDSLTYMIHNSIRPSKTPIYSAEQESRKRSREEDVLSGNMEVLLSSFFLFSLLTFSVLLYLFSYFLFSLLLCSLLHFLYFIMTPPAHQHLLFTSYTITITITSLLTIYSSQHNRTSGLAINYITNRVVG
jgi:ABC-type multidrug transport system permease subunit